MINAAASSVRAASRRSRRHVLAGTSPPTILPAEVSAARTPAQCKCGEPMFWDDDVNRYLCPARWDGAQAHVGWDTPSILQATP